MPSGPYSVFDGYNLTLHRADGSVAGSWPAISGQPGYQRPSQQNRRDVGPIPEGNYSYPLDQVQYLNSRNETLGLAKAFRRDWGEWPGSMWAWGTQRVFLVPDASTDTLGRSDFSIHGGFQPGSRGCVDLGPNEDAYFAAVRRLGGQTHDLIVRYDPRLEVEPHPLASQRWFDGIHDYLFRPIPGLLTPKGDYFPDVSGGGRLQFPDPHGSIPGPSSQDRERIPPSLSPNTPATIQPANTPTGINPLPFDPMNDPNRFAANEGNGASSADGPGRQPNMPNRAAPPQWVVDNANHLTANGVSITHRSLYLANTVGPQRVVDFVSGRGPAPEGIGLPDPATQAQIRSWVRQLRGIPEPMSTDFSGDAPAPAGAPGDVPAIGMADYPAS